MESTHRLTIGPKIIYSTTYTQPLFELNLSAPPIEEQIIPCGVAADSKGFSFLLWSENQQKAASSAPLVFMQFIIRDSAPQRPCTS